MTIDASGRIFQLSSDGQLTEAFEAPFVLEDQLQGLLAAHPNLLPGDQIDPETPRRWLLVDREVAVPGESTSWALDHLFVDQDAIPTLVEVKRGSNPELRRKVVGQMLDYAANAPLAWLPGTLRSLYEARCNGSGLDSRSELTNALGDGLESDRFWSAVDENLAARKLRLLFVTDRMVPELRRVVEFLNEQMSRAEVLAIEIRQYLGSQGSILVPTVFGRTLAAEDKKSQPGVSWDERRFMDELAEKREAPIVAMARDLLTWSAQHGDAVYWGKGKQLGSFAPVFEADGSVYPFIVWTSGSIELQFQYLKNHAPFDDAGMREELRTRLNDRLGLTIPADRIDRRPSFDLSAIVDDDRLALFLEIVMWVVERIRWTRTQRTSAPMVGAGKETAE